MFIALEGIDSSGKTLQCKLLYDYLKKRHKCVLTQEPTDSGPVGIFIKSILRGAAKLDSTAFQLLYVADRADHLQKVILPALAKGAHVITSRYFFSTIAYGSASGVDKEWLKAMNSRFPLPEITFIIDMDVDSAMERKRQQRLRQNAQPDLFESQLKLMRAVRKIYLELASEYPNCQIVDGNQSTENIHKEIIRVLEKHL